jgi:tryptophan aminotransferase
VGCSRSRDVLLVGCCFSLRAGTGANGRFSHKHRFKLLLSPDSPAVEADGDSEALIRLKALEAGVLALPGTVFLPSGGKTAYVRAAFSLLGEEEVDEGLRRLREVVLEGRR